MTHRLPTVSLALSVAALAAGDWLVAGSTADGPDTTRNPVVQTPTEAEVARALAGPGASATVDGCAVTIERAGERGYRLHVRNPAQTPVTLILEFETWETRGNLLSRSLPRPKRQAAETVRLTLEGESEARSDLRYADPAPAEVEAARAADRVRAHRGGVDREFRSVEFVLRRPAAADEGAGPGPEVARLRLPDPTEAAAVPSDEATG